MITIIRVKLHNKNISELLNTTQWFSSAKESRLDNDLKSNEHYYFPIRFRRFLITIIIFCLFLEFYYISYLQVILFQLPSSANVKRFNFIVS